MRLEYKYLIDDLKIEQFRRELRPYVIDDDFYNGDNLYVVRSIYFDTHKLKYYWERIDGIRKRKKLRIRGYNDADGGNIIFLEVKRKYESFIKKNRSALEIDNLESLLKSKNIEAHVVTENGFSTSIEDAERFMHHMYKRSLKPVILIVYDREAYFSKFDDGLRITFDMNLRYRMLPKLSNLYENNLKNTLRGKTILEIKFTAGFPKWLQNMIRDYELQRQPVSKYTICIDSAKRNDPYISKKILAANLNLIS